uniref:Uncharacterized protein n=1 Tax=Trichobilharzia regenti TaxID=157069 RepID=A0AA85IQC0_TRIRE|nr:unnamed protein product [Trichobilharzia regenti]
MSIKKESHIYSTTSAINTISTMTTSSNEVKNENQTILPFTPSDELSSTQDSVNSRSNTELFKSGSNQSSVERRTWEFIWEVSISLTRGCYFHSLLFTDFHHSVSTDYNSVGNLSSRVTCNSGNSSTV